MVEKSRGSGPETREGWATILLVNAWMKQSMSCRRSPLVSRMRAWKADVGSSVFLASTAAYEGMILSPELLRRTWNLGVVDCMDKPWVRWLPRLGHELLWHLWHLCVPGSLDKPWLC